MAVVSQNSWSTHRLRAWLVINWTTLALMPLPTQLLLAIKALFPTSGLILDIGQVSIDFGLNEIPSATVNIAVGRNFNNNGSAAISAIHFIVQQLKLFVQANIYVTGQVRSHVGTFEKWPTRSGSGPKPFRIFNGYIIGTGFQKTSQHAEFTITLTHWLSDLNFSSSVSRSNSPLNPSQLSYDPVLPIVQSAGARGPGLYGHGVPNTQAAVIVNSAALTTDLWGNTADAGVAANGPQATSALGIGGLKQWYTYLAMADRMNWMQVQFPNYPRQLPANTPAKKNVEALAALQLIEPLSNGYIDGVPLRMKKDRVGVDNIANMMATGIAQESSDISQLWGYTMWDKLLQHGSDMQFAIVPQVEKALIVPFNPGLRKPWTTIYAKEYDYFEQAHSIPRPLRGVGFFANMAMGGGGDVSGNNKPIYNMPGPYYENSSRRNGLVIWKTAPRWLTQVALPHSYQMVGAFNNSFDTRTATAPGQPDPKQKIEQTKSLWTDFARAAYIQEILRGRTGRLSGRLRFDIAPGSIIRIEEPEEPFVLQEAGLSPSFVFAQVIRVSCVLNAEAQKAGTAIQFAFTKNDVENKDDSYSTDRHPLWECSWYGAPLVNEPEFYPGGINSVQSPPSCPS